MSETLKIDSDIDAFIDHAFEALKAYDARRPAGHPYQFDQHSERVAKDMHNLALRMNFSEADAYILQRLSLVHDIGKSALPVEIWDSQDRPSPEVKALRREHTTKGVELVDKRFGADDDRPVLVMMRSLMSDHHENMDGSGWQKKTADDLSVMVRMLCICDAFDGYSTARPHFKDRDLSVDAVLTRMAVEKKGEYDPDILAQFSAMKKNYTPRAQHSRTVLNAKL